MFDPLFLWLESTAFSTWMRESPSLLAFPGILAVHTIGLGLLAGLNGAMDLRLLGAARDIPVMAFRRFLPLMWLGLWLNGLTGLALLLAYPTKALTNPVFYLKLTLIAGNLMLLRVVLERAQASDSAPGLKLLAALSLIIWAVTITAGRLLAYTCTRLMVNEMCL
jgi:hypothetical protein